MTATTGNQHLNFRFCIQRVLLCVLFFAGLASAAQTTDTARNAIVVTDTTVRPLVRDTMVVAGTEAAQKKADSIIRTHSPRKAAIRSAIIPGWGQIYNKKYWKLPLVYGALGTTAGIFLWNVNNYRDYRFAFQAKYKAALPPYDPTKPGATGPFRDSTDYFKIRPDLIIYSQNTLKRGRDGFRRDVDYSVLFFLLFWGLNVVDATVDAHLKAFDVSPDLSLRFRGGYSELARTNGVSLVLHFK